MTTTLPINRLVMIVTPPTADVVDSDLDDAASLEIIVKSIALHNMDFTSDGLSSRGGLQRGDLQDEMEFLGRHNGRELRVHRRNAIGIVHYRPRVFRGKRGIEKDRESHDRFGEKIVEEPEVIPSSLEKKIVTCKRMVFGPYLRTTSQTPANASSLNGATVHPVASSNAATLASTTLSTAVCCPYEMIIQKHIFHESEY
ncbi:hypothetical protein F3Y22_tig00110356pilonHSYRG00109 [Hibiscus syriacus]|uniref:Uncharacterized protein n=1 Tax=Hibiscus syriacus TaxID=106335 RepID=A0A6A3AWC5_HIBSY|nr:hypothetical protein F3Y22_tig00110356pilonHSYRG00109 [Hibiscus syriacus]